MSPLSFGYAATTTYPFQNFTDRSRQQPVKFPPRFPTSQEAVVNKAKNRQTLAPYLRQQQDAKYREGLVKTFWAGLGLGVAAEIVVGLMQSVKTAFSPVGLLKAGYHGVALGLVCTGAAALTYNWMTRKQQA